MTTRVHATTKTGTRGELKAAVIFTDIGWAPPARLGEDIGTDVITFARDTAAPEDKDDARDLVASARAPTEAECTFTLRP